MCGICAVMMENRNKDFPIGCLLYKMMESQQIRAQDSTGVAIFNKWIKQRVLQNRLF